MSRQKTTKPDDNYERRYVHAARARKLRKLGHHVQFDRWEAGRPVYVWFRPVAPKETP